MGPVADLAHHVPGRLRLKVAAGRRRPDVLEGIQRAVWPLEGVRAVDINPMTGSVLIEYQGDAQTFPQYIADHGQRSGVFTLHRPGLEPPTGLARAITDVTHRVNGVVRETVHGAADLRELLPIAIGLYAVFAVDRAVGAPLWLSLLFFSFSSYQGLHPTEEIQDVQTTLQELRSDIAAVKGTLDRIAST
jgi:hypothetical protein